MKIIIMQKTWLSLKIFTKIRYDLFKLLSKNPQHCQKTHILYRSNNRIFRSAELQNAFYSFYSARITGGVVFFFKKSISILHLRQAKDKPRAPWSEGSL